MSAIEELVQKRFPHYADLRMMFSTLDVNILHVGKMVENIHDLAVYADGSAIDVDRIAAAANSLFALLGHTGELIDAIERQTIEATSRAQ